MKYTINNKTRINKYTIALATSTAMMASASAATIIWGEFDLDAAPGEISTNGTSIEAINMVNNDAREATDTTTINGVVFTANNLFDNGYHRDTDFGVSTGDDSLDLLYLQASFDYKNTQLILTGLTIGNEYELQNFLGFSINGISYLMNVGDGTTIQKTSSGTTENGAWITGTFIADATTQTFHSSSDSNVSSFLSGYQLRDISPVPEPSSTALIGLGGLALILRRSK